jgi:hypothetical protein
MKVFHLLVALGVTAVLSAVESEDFSSSSLSTEEDTTQNDADVFLPDHLRHLKLASTNQVVISKTPTKTTATSSTSMGRQGLCVMGCSPYVDLNQPEHGINKYMALVEDMAKTCDVIIHTGDSKPPMMPCNQTILTRSVWWMIDAASSQGKIALYTPGDNELNDCLRAGSGNDKSGLPVTISADYYRASQSRTFMVQDLGLKSGKDLTSKYSVDTHHAFRSSMMVPGTNNSYACDFDKYVELDYFAVATVEVTGSHWYLDDSRHSGYPRQDIVDPLKDRLGMYLNAMECTVDWIRQSAAKASANGKRALFIAMHSFFYTKFGAEPIGHPKGEFYAEKNFLRFMKNVAGRTDVPKVYQPLFDVLTQVALKYPNLQIYVIHADGHRFQTLRMNPELNNVASANNGTINHVTNHNLMAQMVEGTSRSLTTWVRFTVDPLSFQPVSVKEEWSRVAYNREPKGHSWVPFSSTTKNL